MAEASDTCLHSLFFYVHNPRMLRPLMEHTTKEKAGRVRASCQVSASTCSLTSLSLSLSLSLPLCPL